MSVANPGLGATSGSLFFDITIATASLTFGNAAHVTAGRLPEALAVADFNGDGNADVAVSDRSLGAVSIFLGNGDGTFTLKSTLPSGGGAVAVGDFNGDGKLDLAVTQHQASMVTIYLGNGDGTFNAASTLTVVQATGITVGDFNKDGRLDLAISDFTKKFYVALGNGDGTFGAVFTTTLTHLGQSIAAGDFNGDGTLDLMVAGFDESDAYLGNGDGTFHLGSKNFIAGSCSIALGDFNGDGNLDAAIAGSGVGILLGNGDGTFQFSSAPTTGPRPVTVATGDFNGDGALDLAVGDNQNKTVAFLLGNGDGTFRKSTVAPAVTTGFLGVAAGDFNNDGRLDVAAVDNNASFGSAVVFIQKTVTFSTQFLSFGGQKVGTHSNPKPVTLTNIATTPLTISSITLAGMNPTDYSQTNTCGASLAPGATCTISVTFAPLVQGDLPAAVVVKDSQGTQSIRLTGVGT